MQNLDFDFDDQEPSSRNLKPNVLIHVPGLVLSLHVQ